MEQIIKSFEEGAEYAGDILSRRKNPKDIKIGLLTLGYFEYWRMFPNLKDKVKEGLKEVENNFTKRFDDVVLSGLVDSLDKADAAGRMFLEKNVDIVVLVCGTYMPDFISLAALDFVKHKPLIMFSMQLEEDVNLKGNYEGSLLNSGIIGVSQLTGTLKKLKREFEVVVGSIKDDRAYESIAKRVRALKAVKDLNESNIGIIGHVFRGMYDIELSKTFLKSTFGVNVILIQSSHLLEIWQDVTENEVNLEKDKLLNRFATKNISENDVFNAIKLAIAMRKISEKFNLNAMCFLDQHFIQRQVKTSARIGASLLMETTDMSLNCEGDLGGLITMMLMKNISGKSSLMGEWSEYDSNTNSCFVIGHGIGTPDLAKSDKDIMLTRTPEEWGFDGAGLNYEMQMKAGPATLSHIMEAPNGYRMILSKGEVLDMPALSFDEIYAFFKTEKPIKTYLEEVFEYGVSHHCILSENDITEEMKYAAKYLNIEVKVI